MNTKSKYIKKVRKYRENFKSKKTKISENLNLVSDIIVDSPKTFLQKGDKYIYDISNILETNVSNITKSIKKVFVCIYLIISDENRINVALPYLQFLLFKYNKNRNHFSNTCIFPFIEVKNKSYIKSADKLVKNLIDCQLKNDGFIQSGNNLFVFYNYTKKSNPSCDIIDGN